MSQLPAGGNAAPPPSSCAPPPSAPSPSDESMLDVARVPLPVLRASRACVASILRRAEAANDGQREELARLLSAIDAALLAGEVIAAAGAGLPGYSLTDWSQRLPVLARRVSDDERLNRVDRSDLATLISRLGAKFTVLAGLHENDRTPPGYTPSDVAGALGAGAVVTSRSCSWCHRLNRTDVLVCPGCGHHAQVARLDCTCAKCWKEKAAANGVRGGLQL